MGLTVFCFESELFHPEIFGRFDPTPVDSGHGKYGNSWLATGPKHLPRASRFRELHWPRAQILCSPRAKIDTPMIANDYTRQSSYNTIWIVWFAGLSLESEEVVKQVLNDWLQNKVWSNFGTPGKQVFVASSSASRPWNAAAFGWAGTSEGIGVCTVQTVYKAILALVFRLPTQGSRNCRKSCDCCFSAAFVSKWHST